METQIQENEHSSESSHLSLCDLVAFESRQPWITDGPNCILLCQEFGNAKRIGGLTLYT